MSQFLQNMMATFTNIANQQTATLNAQAAHLARQDQTQAEIDARLIDSRRQVADAAAETTRKEALLSHDIAASRERAATILSLDDSNVENQLVENMGTYDFAERERRSVRREIDRLQSINILDNPVAFLAAQLKLPQLASRNNQLVATRDSAARDINTRQDLLRQQQSLATAATAGQLQDIQHAKARNEFLAAQANIIELEGQVATRAGARYLAQLQVDHAKAEVAGNLAERGMQVTNLIEDRRDRAAARADAAESRNLRRQELQLRLNENKLEQDQTNLLSSNLAALGVAIGRAPLTIPEVRMMPAAMQAQILNAAGTGNLGNSPTEVAAFIQRFGNVAILETNNPALVQTMRAANAGIQALMPEATRLLRTPAGGSNMSPSSEEIRAKAEQLYISSIRDSATNPQTTDATNSARFTNIFNPYVARHSDLLASPVGAALRNNRFTTTLKNVNSALPRTAGVITREEEQLAWRTLAQQIAARQVPLDLAATAVVEHYRTAAAFNRDTMNYTILGLPPQESNMMVFTTSGFFGREIRVDSMNVSSVKEALSRFAVGEATHQQRRAMEHERIIGEITAPRPAPPATPPAQ